MPDRILTISFAISFVAHLALLLVRGLPLLWFRTFRPMGHIEVIYDLDIKARQIAEAHGLHQIRAATVNDHPTFIRMMADVVRGVLKGAATIPPPLAGEDKGGGDEFPISAHCGCRRWHCRSGCCSSGDGIEPDTSPSACSHTP